MGYRDHLKSMGYSGADVPMLSKINEWFGWYTADNDWYSSTEVATDQRRTYKVERLSIKPARMVCQEWASLLLNERTVITCEDGATSEWLTDYLEQTHFFETGQRLLERSFALGTAAWALRVENIAVDAALSPGARIVAQRFDARSIIPLTYDEDTCTECAFISKTVMLGKTLTQLQVHRRDERGIYVIETALFDGRGRRVFVDGIADTFITGTTKPLFSLVRPGLENTHWDYGPFGVSVFDDAIGAVKLTDTAVDGMFRDIWLGQKMLFLDERMLDQDQSGNVVVPRASDQQLFRKTEGGSDRLIEEYNPDLRITDNREALETALKVLGRRCGMGDDYLAIGAGNGNVLTATQVVAGKSDLFRNVRKHENSIGPAIATIAAGIVELARIVKGVPLSEDPGAFSVLFDDSVIEDTNAMRQRDLGDVAAGMMHPWEYRMKWYGEDEDKAKSMVPDAIPTE